MEQALYTTSEESPYPGPKVYVETFGCQMNESDTERLLSFLSDLSYRRTAEPSDADLIIVNTCSVRDKAEQKVWSALGRFRRLKSARPEVIIGVSGCVAQQAGPKILKRLPYVDMVVGTASLHRIGEIIGEVREKRRVVETSMARAIDEGEYPSERTLVEGIKAFVNIMRGCDNYCTYCIVPYTRGPEVSRHAGEILEEVRGLAERGVKEVTLLGQNVNSYRDPGGITFPELLRKVARTEGILRVRFVTSHPKDISDELIYLFGEELKLPRALHLPVQSGSDRVLGRMNRGYTRARYLEIVSKLKKLYPDMAITTDIIVGFPGETDEDFNATMDLVREVGFDGAFSFAYSPRPGTTAASFEDAVDPDVKSGRLSILQETLRDIAMKKAERLVGQKARVLVEGPSKNNPAEYTGRTPSGRVVNFPAPSGLEGCLIEVEITEAYQNSLRGLYRAG